MWKRLKRRYHRLFIVLGGIFIIIDQIGRYQTLASLYGSVKNWFASKTDIHLNWPLTNLAWPAHSLLFVGVFFVLLGLISFFWPIKAAPKQLAQPETSEASSASTAEVVPHVDLIFDLPKCDDTRWLVRDGNIKVVNTSDTIAYDVSIQPKESHLYKAEFETISRLEKGRPVDAVMDLRAKPSGTCYGQFEALLKFELENSSEDDDFKVRVPLLVRYYDATKKILYQTAHEVVYDAFWREAHVHLVQGTVPVKIPSGNASVPTKTPDDLVRYIMRGEERLMAYKVTRPGITPWFIVERIIPGQEPRLCETLDFREANAQWHEWYKEWEGQPGAFGGSFGNGLDGKLPWWSTGPAAMCVWTSPPN